MDLSEHTTSGKLERYAFMWLLALLLFSAGAMFLGARPPITLITGYYSSAVWSLLNLSWLICGAAAIYLTYQWAQHKKEVFGGKDMKDTVAFVFMLAAGYNLGITGALGNNIFLNAVMGQLALMVTGVLCLLAAYHLYTRWKGNGEMVFMSGSAAGDDMSQESMADDAMEDAMADAEESHDSMSDEVQMDDSERRDISH